MSNRVSRLLAVVVWVASAGWVFAALNLRSPYLLAVREAVMWVWVAAGLLALVWWIFRGKKDFPRLRHLAAAAAVLGGLLAGYGHWRHFQNRRIVAETPAAQMPEIGKHLVVGLARVRGNARSSSQGRDRRNISNPA